MKQPQARWSWRHWRKHFVTSVLMACFFFAVLKACEWAELPFFQVMDRWGQDAAMRVYSTWSLESGPKVVLVELAIKSGTAAADLEDLAGLLDLIRGLGPRAVALDATVAEYVSPDRASLLVNALANREWRDKSPNVQVALPMENATLEHSLAEVAWVRAAAPDFKPDDDGIVRQIGETACTVGTGEITVIRPTLAQAVTGAVSPPTFGCAGEKAVMRNILFGRERNRSDDHGSGVLLLPEQALASHADAIRAAYVVIGHIGPGTDAFVTPLGLMSGARIHAAAVWTLASERTATVGRSWPVVFAWELAIWLILGSLSATYTTLLVREPDTFQLERRKFGEVFRRFLVGIVGLLCTVAVLQVMVLGWTRLAAGMIETGTFVGTVLPAFGALLEAFAHASRFVVGLAEWISERILHRTGRLMRRPSRPPPALLLAFAVGLLPAVPCVAAEASKPCSNHLMHVQLDPVNVTIERRSRHVMLLDLPMELEQDDVIIVRGPDTATVEQDFWGEKKETKIQGPDAMLLLPCPPNRETWTGWWEAFWGAANLHIGTPRREGTTLARGVANLEHPYLSGKLRELSNLAPAAGVVGGAQGFAFAWAGGSPPYRVTMRDGATGVPLQSGTFNSPEAWWPAWQVPTGPMVVVVRDGDGVELRRSLTERPAPGIPDVDTINALHLFERSPADRLEALRRIRVRSAEDPLARRALEAVRLAGGRE